jgi:hypothetical protein
MKKGIIIGLICVYLLYIHAIAALVPIRSKKGKAHLRIRVDEIEGVLYWL